tara:strand:+ start:2623 stop:3948 length:1326 start_codon:yes stop_codon:yes gene_type:complete
MPTRYSIQKGDFEVVDTGYMEKDVPDDFTIPSCTIEDVDRGVFNLFNKELPLFYKRKDQMKKVPVIFATGERFAILARNKPLRDKSNALILPLISIIRTGIDQEGAKGAGQGQGGPITIRTKIAKDDERYQRWFNNLGFKNSDDIAIAANDKNDDGDGGATKAGRIATRRAAVSIPFSSRRGTILKPNVSGNLMEFIQMPPIKQYTASYEVTFWTQYTQEMNTLITVMMGGYVENRRRTFVINTDDGYRFTAFVDAALNPQNNFDDFTDAERLVKYSFNLSVAAYLVAGQEPGQPVPFRKTISSPEISFGVDSTIGGVSTAPPAGTYNADTAAWILSDAATTGDGYPPASIGMSPMQAAVARGFPGTPQVEIGGQNAGTIAGQTGRTTPTTIITNINPFTGKPEHMEIQISSMNQKSGETVFRFSKNSPEGILLDLGKLLK